MDLKKAIASLTEHGFAVHYFETAAEAAGTFCAEFLILERNRLLFRAKSNKL